MKEHQAHNLHHDLNRDFKEKVLELRAMYKVPMVFLGKDLEMFILGILLGALFVLINL
jgi:hypothetical protein